ncbi:MFS transporter [Ramlibacter sp. WS9]|uniref:MFS transporter n=1 Tax=Ramlibacter sp. WS9 TaxID=1882741 RepID=UPI00114415F0|nr:MFS transporter [Ramlibacter sp. WS9]ROZ75458.1 MFS transporter [Ramlibacter sp. WS9]
MNSAIAAAAGGQRKQVAFWLVLVAAAGTFALTMGTRQTMGLFMSPMNTATGLGIGSISLAFAFGQLWWGLTQPFAGAMADKVGAGRVLFAGAVLVAIGTFITPYMTTTLGLILAIGVLSAGGAGMAGPAVLMAATTRLIPAEKRGLATGIVNAGGSFGQFVMAPIAGALMTGMGWAGAMQVLGLVVLLALPAAFLLKGNSLQSAPAGQKVVGTGDAIRTALRNPSYLLLAAGFFVCGFHVAFLATHLPGVIAACGLPVQFAAWSLAMIGLFNIIGSVAMGWAVGRWRMKSLLSLLYAVRGLAVLVFLLAPKTGPVVLIFAAVMGVTFLSTVPPTAGLVAKFFGPANMATLFGIVMLTHQVGGFLGAWLGGKVFEATGSYDWVWYIDIVLAIGAALVHLPIREALPKPAAAAAAA